MNALQNQKHLYMISIRHFTFLIITLLMAIALMSIAVPKHVYAEVECSAQITNPSADCKKLKDCDTPGQSPTSENCGIVKLLATAINLLSGLVGIAVVISLIIAGIQYSASAGDPQAVAASKKRIQNSILALVVFAFTYGFLQWLVPGGLF